MCENNRKIMSPPIKYLIYVVLKYALINNTENGRRTKATRVKNFSQQLVAAYSYSFIKVYV